MDSSGVSRSIECDDHEALLVGAWVRTGCWLQPHLLNRLELDVQVSSEPAEGSLNGGGRQDLEPQSSEGLAIRGPKVARKPSSKKQLAQILVLP